MELVFNLFDADVGAIRKYDTHLAYMSRTTRTFLDFSGLTSIILAIGFILLAFIVPKWKPVTRLVALKEWCARTVAFVITISSFVFLQQAPSKYEQWQEHKLIRSERAEIDTDDWSNKVSIQVVENIIQHLPSDRLVEYRDRFEILKDHFPYPQHDSILKRMSKPAKPTESVAISPIAVSVVEKSSEDSTQTVEGLKNLFCELIGAVTPEIKGIAGKFVEHLVDAEAERIFDVYVKQKVQRLSDKQVVKVEAAREFTILVIDPNYAGSAHSNESDAEEMKRLQQEIEHLSKQIEHDKIDTELRENIEHPVEEEVP